MTSRLILNCSLNLQFFWTKLPLFIQHLDKFSSPFDDIKVVPVVSLVDDVLLSLNPRLKHGV